MLNIVLWYSVYICIKWEWSGIVVIFIVWMMIVIAIVIVTCLNVPLNFQTSNQLVCYQFFLLNQTFGLDFWIAGAGIQHSVWTIVFDFVLINWRIDELTNFWRGENDQLFIKCDNWKIHQTHGYTGLIKTIEKESVVVNVVLVKWFNT